MVITGESSESGVCLLRSLFSPGAETSAWGWLCQPGVQVLAFPGAGGEMGLYPSCGCQWCLGPSPNLATRPRGIPPGGLSRTSVCTPALLSWWSTLQCFCGLCPWQGCLPFAALHCWTLGQQLLGQPSVFISSLCLAACSWGWSGCLSTVREPACVQPCAWNSFPNLKIR